MPKGDAQLLKMRGNNKGICDAAALQMRGDNKGCQTNGRDAGDNSMHAAVSARCSDCTNIGVYVCSYAARVHAATHAHQPEAPRVREAG